MSQRYSKKPRQPQGRSNAWLNVPRAQQSHAGGVSVDGTHSTRQGVYSNPQLAHALTTLIGRVVEVKTTSGSVFEGILRAVSPNLDVALSVAHDKSKVLSRDNVKNILELKFNSIVNISAKIEPSSSSTTDIFKTDTEISKRNGPSPVRELERFTDFADAPDGLEMENSSGWSVEEMFSVNKEKFKVTTNFDSEMSQYTTELNRKGEGYQDRAARAKVLANEIEGKSSHRFDDVGTEEELFSSVVREHKEAPPPPSITTTSSHLNTPTQSTTFTPRAHADVPSTTENSSTSTDLSKSNQTPHITSTDSPATFNDDAVTAVEPDSTTKSESGNCIVTSNSSDNNSQVGVAAPSSGTPVEELVTKVEEATVLDPVHPSTSSTVETTLTEAVPTSTTSPATKAQSTTEIPPASDKRPQEPTKKSTFKLNPLAKEFKMPVAGFSPTVTAASSNPASPSHTLTTTTPATTYYPHPRRQYNKRQQPRGITPAPNVYQGSEFVVQPGRFMIPQGSGVSGMVQPTPIVGPGNQVLFPAGPGYQVPTAPPGMLNYAHHLQQVGTSAVAGATPTPQQPLMLAPVQQAPVFQQHVLTQQPGLFQQPTGGQLQGAGTVLPGMGPTGAASQAQPYQQVIYSPQAGQVMYTPQGHPGGGVTTPIMVSLHSTAQPQPLITAVNPQPPVFSSSQRVGFTPYPPGK